MPAQQQSRERAAVERIVPAGLRCKGHAKKEMRLERTHRVRCRMYCTGQNVGSTQNKATSRVDATRCGVM